MRLRRKSKEYVTPVVRDGSGWSFQMSPGVTIRVEPNQDQEWFAERLAKIIHDVAETEWT